MGDEGRLYVPPDMVDAYRSDILPLASVLVPNQFEAELLSQCKINSVEEGFEACRQLQSKGPHTVVSFLLKISMVRCDGYPCYQSGPDRMTITDSL